MLIEHITGEGWKEHNQSLIDFEAQFSYPSKEGEFSISHAPNYKDFFESLRFNIDSPQLFLAKSETQEILGLIVTVLQKIPYEDGFIYTWYLCDFKIAHKSLGFLVLLKLLNTLKKTCFPICSNAYTISMNPKEGPNRLSIFCERNPFLQFKKACDFNLYEIKNWDKFKRPDQSLIKSSKAILNNCVPLNLWHVTNNSTRSVTLDLESSPLILYADIHHHNLPLWGTCAIMHYGMEFMKWDWVCSADI